MGKLSVPSISKEVLASGIPPVPSNVAPPKTSSSSDSTGCPTGSVRNKNNNGLANIGQIEADELEHIYESLDLKKLISTSKLPPYGPTSQNNVLIIYILPLLISFIFKVRCGIFFPSSTKCLIFILFGLYLTTFHSTNWPIFCHKSFIVVKIQS